MNPLYPSVAIRAEHRCEYCHAPEVVFNFRFEVEHFIPTSHGGQDHDANLALSCRSCNLYKSFHVTGVDDETMSEVPLFDPRRQRWDDHFRVDPATGMMIGATPTGRATIRRLAMNSDAQMESRRLWMRLNLFP
jgi:hypothetical protein